MARSFKASNIKNLSMKRRIVICLATALASGMFYGCTPDGPLPEANANIQDITFARMAAMSNYAEISTGQLALTKSQDSTIKAFAAMMVTDHTDAGQKLKSLAGSLGLSAPDSLDAAHM